MTKIIQKFLTLQSWAGRNIILLNQKWWNLTTKLNNEVLNKHGGNTCTIVSSHRALLHPSGKPDSVLQYAWIRKIRNGVLDTFRSIFRWLDLIRLTRIISFGSGNYLQCALKFNAFNTTQKFSYSIKRVFINIITSAGDAKNTEKKSPCKSQLV